jgi:hypothetical protein
MCARTCAIARCHATGKRAAPFGLRGNGTLSTISSS